MIDTILQSVIVTFVSLMMLCLGIAIFIGYLINKAGDLGGPGFLSHQVVNEDSTFRPFPAEAASDVGLEGTVQNPRTIWNFPGSSANSPESRLEGSGALQRPSPTQSPCRFCRRVRDAVVNAWNKA